MDIYQENLQILKKRYPHIYHRLLFKKSPRFSIENSKNEKYPTILARDGKGRFFLHSSYDPREEARRTVESLDLSKLSSLWVMGTGMGYHIMELMNKRNRGFITVILETDLNLFDVFLHTSVATEALQWPYFLFSAGEKVDLLSDVESLLQTKLNFNMGRARFLVLPGFERYDGKTYRELADKAISFTKYRYNSLGNSVEDTIDGIVNSFKNLDVMANSPGIRQLEGKYKGIPAILVAAGPSLDKNIDLIAEAKGKALIISSDTTFPVLLRKGIIPDMVVTVERIPEVYERFYSGIDIPPETWLAALNVADNRIFKAFPDRHLLAFRITEPQSRWLDSVTGHKGGVMTGLSVAHLAFSIANLAGCEPIILVGQDLALAESGQYYVSGTEDSDGKADKSGDVWVKDYSGQLIKSTKMLKHFLDWFEIMLKSVKTRCIDATEGGAYIEGTEIMTLREAIDTYCLGSPGVTPLREVVGNYDPIALDFFIEQLQDFKRDFEGIVSFIEDSQDTIDELEKRDDLNIEKKGVEVQEALNEVFWKITYRGRVAFGIQAITSTAMTRLGSYGQLQGEEDIKEFIKYVRRFFNELSQALEIWMYTIERIIRDTRSGIRTANQNQYEGVKEMAVNV
ncbi:MAG: motility associated factor glycosyltransferase family protein [Firmicutes bacterium]|nr:motility associated factor glycosyltransferase family protein [Bacillota bacterium]